MDIRLTIVTELPLPELWDSSGTFGERLRDVTATELKELLREGAFRFVEADIGHTLRWVPLDDCYEHWGRVRPNIFAQGQPRLEDYPSEFFFRASEWRVQQGDRIILLEKYH